MSHHHHHHNHEEDHHHEHDYHDHDHHDHQKEDSSISPFREDPSLSNKAQHQLLIVSLICIIFMVIEVLGGYYSGSIAILADAAHLLSDLLSFFVGIVSIRLSIKRISPQFLTSSS